MTVQPQEVSLRKAVLAEALQLRSDERISLIQRAFPHDPQQWDELLVILDGFQRAAHSNPGWTRDTTFGGVLTPPATVPVPATAATALLTVGAKLGPYRVVRMLEPGGMGEVAIADDARLPRQVVLKCLAGKWLSVPLARQRLMREARTAAALSHPNVATLYDVLEDTEQPILVMEYVEGRTLRDVLRDGPVPLGLALRYATQITDAVSYAHDRGIIHCDIKPSNVQITPSHVAKVLDFGLARAQFDAGDELSAIEAGKVMGTPGYMAPERLVRGVLNTAGDIYGLGVVLFELLTNRPPFTEIGPELMLAVLAQDAPSPSSIVPSLPRQLDAIVGRALARNPELRYRSALELGRDLGEALLTVEGRPPSGAFPLVDAVGPKPWWRNPAAVLIAGLALLAVLTFAGLTAVSFYNSPLGRIEGFETETVLSWPRFGVNALVAPLVYMALLAMGAVAVVMAGRLTYTAIPPLRRLCRPLVEAVTRSRTKVEAVPSATLAAALIVVQAAAAAIFIWRFWPIVVALHGFVTRTPAADLRSLTVANHPEHSLFGRLLSVQMLLFGASWYWMAKRAWRRHEGDAITLAAGGATIIALILFFGQIVPFRILYHSEAERVSYESKPCYLVGQRGDDGLLFCPLQPPPWKRIVKLNDPQLKREGIPESIFTPLAERR